MIVEKHPKHGTLLFGRFKPRFIIITIVAILALASLAYIVYGYTTPSYLLSGSIGNAQNSSINSSYTIIGNGVHNLSIEVTLLNGLHEAMSGVTINAQANIGTATSCTTTNGTCFIDYTPPRTSNPENATLFINVGNVQKNINLVIKPDYPTQLVISSNATNQSVYTGSEVAYSVSAIDAFGNPAPNGTIVNFSYTSGRLSATSCIITNGLCNVTYYAPSSSGTAIIYVSSVKLSYQTSLDILSRISVVTNKILDFSTSGSAGNFCITSPTNIYASEQANLQAGANVTWEFNQYLPLTAVYVFNQQQFNSFTSILQNATSSYSTWANMCSGDWQYSNDTSLQQFCSNNYYESHYSYPFEYLPNQLASLSPIIAQLPQQSNNGYLSSISFTAPASETYYFVLFPFDVNTFDTTLQLPLCYNDSYAYTTSIVHNG